MQLCAPLRASTAAACVPLWCRGLPVPSDACGAASAVWERINARDPVQRQCSITALRHLGAPRARGPLTSRDPMIFFFQGRGEKARPLLVLCTRVSLSSFPAAFGSLESVATGGCTPHYQRRTAA